MKKFAISANNDLKQSVMESEIFASDFNKKAKQKFGFFIISN